MHIDQSWIQIIVTLLIIPAMWAMWDRLMKKYEKSRDEVNREKAKEEEHWRNYVTQSFNNMSSKLTSYCTNNSREHEELFDRARDAEGKIKVIEAIHHQKGCDEPSQKQ